MQLVNKRVRRVCFAGNRCMSNSGVRRVLTALLSPPFNPKLMSIDVSACGFGFIFASHIQVRPTRSPTDKL